MARYAMQAWFLFFLAFAVPVAATAEAGAGERKFSIGVCVMGLRHPYFNDMLDEIQKNAAKAGVEIAAGDADFDAQRQERIIDGYVARKVSLILVAPFDAKALAPAIAKAQRAGIPVMTVDAAGDWPGVISHCASDNVAGGRLAGGLMLERLSEKGNRNGGTVLVLDHAGVTSTFQRVKGFKDVLALRGKQYTVDIVDAVGQEEFALERGSEALALMGKDLIAVFATNDGMTMGSLHAAEMAGRAGELVVVGYDFVEEAKKAVDDGRITGIVVQFPRRIGAAAFKIAHDYLTGKNTRPPKESLVEVGTYTKDGFLDQRGNPID